MLVNSVTSAPTDCCVQFNPLLEVVSMTPSQPAAQQVLDDGQEIVSSRLPCQGQLVPPLLVARMPVLLTAQQSSALAHETPVTARTAAVFCRVPLDPPSLGASTPAMPHSLF